jgi:hypothetical protein
LIADARDRASLAAVQKLAATVGYLADVEPGERARIAFGVWLGALDLCKHELEQLSVLVLENTWIMGDPAKSNEPAGDDKPGCTTDVVERPACSDAQCAGDNGRCSQVG